MKILITGASGFVGKNLCEALKNILDGKDRTRPSLSVEEIFCYDIDSTADELDTYCMEADFVFHLAGVNRPKDPSEFMQGNFGFTSRLLETLRAHGNTCPLMISSSIQATCIGRYDSDYGRSKRAGEELVFAYGKETVAAIREKVEWIAPITVYPGEDELLALTQGALRVLNGEEEAKVY